MSDYSAFQKAVLNVKVNENESGLSPSSISLMEFDSIFQFYPKCKIAISDSTGQLNEYLTFVNGTNLEILFGANDSTSKKCRFVVAKDAVPQQQTVSSIGGAFELETIHEYFYKQYKKSKSYSSNISDIVKSIVKNYNFSQINIESTLNTGNWYQPYVNDSEFINDYLLPFSYSSSSKNTPFFSFINSNNEFCE